MHLVEAAAVAIVGRVESLWRYPVKSMRGEELNEAFVSFAGVYGDRLFAFTGAARPKGFPYVTGREQARMLLYRPRFRHPDRALMPPNWAEAQGVDLNPIPAVPLDLAVDVETPSGAILAVDDPALIRELGEGLDEPRGLTLLRSERAMTDCLPVSLFSIQTAQQLGRELDLNLDKRRFRANVFADLGSAPGFAEDAFVGSTLRVGANVVIAVLKRDTRCVMITIDPDTAARSAAVLSRVTTAHEGKAGVYGAVLVEGVVRIGDDIETVN